MKPINIAIGSLLFVAAVLVIVVANGYLGDTAKAQEGAPPAEEPAPAVDAEPTVAPAPEPMSSMRDLETTRSSSSSPSASESEALVPVTGGCPYRRTCWRHPSSTSITEMGWDLGPHNPGGTVRFTRRQPDERGSRFREVQLPDDAWWASRTTSPPLKTFRRGDLTITVDKYGDPASNTIMTPALRQAFSFLFEDEGED